LLSVYTPAQIRTAYQFNQTSYTGTGQTIAIVDAYSNPNISTDLATFDRQWGIAAPPSFKVVNQFGGSQPQVSNSGWWLEIALDVEWAHAIAPDASILLVEANSNYYSDLMRAVDYAAAHAHVVSMSWGSGEFSDETGQSYDSHFANHPGVTFVASAGDSGAPPEWPAISPNVLSVGGTTLTIQSNGTYVSEKGWNSGGGGISAYEPKPPY
jgi:subtilase family serine protease